MNANGCFVVALMHLSSMKTEVIWCYTLAVTPYHAVLSQSILTQYNLEGAVLWLKMYLVSCCFLRKHQCVNVSLDLAHWCILQELKMCSILVVQYALGEVMIYSKGLIVQEIFETKHSTSSILHMIILQWDHLLFTSISLGNQITCQASFINRTMNRWAIAQGKQENKFIYIISSFRAEVVFSIYTYANCQN